MMNDATIRKGLVRHWKWEGKDFDKSHEIYHEDAVLEFPQSGERFVGKENFLTWRRKYPAQLEFRIRRITGGGEFWVAENLITYDGSAPIFTLNVLQFRGDKIAREYLYVMEGFAPAEFRTEFATSFDPLASVAPDDWQEGTPFGLELNRGR